jgi:hypothetical protein
MRRLGVITTICGVAALLAATFAHASATARFGVQDDAWLIYGSGTLEQRLTTLDDIGTTTVRFTLRWDQVAHTRPAYPLDPADPAYDWAPFDAVFQGLHAHGIDMVVTLWGSPRWANGGHGPAWLPKSGFGDFAYAAAKRYPWVRMWTMWNEPNTRTFSVPVSPSLYVRNVLNPGYAFLHRANRRNLVAGGVTSPRKTTSGLAPYTFMAGMRAAHARLDAYAENPYPGSSHETPFVDPCRVCETFSLARLGLIRADVTRLFGASKQLWLTEYGYQTNPPDRLLGVSPALQAAYVGQAALRVWAQPGVTMLIHFLVRDEPTLGGWQSGLFTTRGAAKPAYFAFALPLAEQSRKGDRAVLWGQVRPGHGRRPYRLQRWTGRTWVYVGGTKLTGIGGTFRTSIVAAPGTRVRVRPLRAPFDSPQLRIS